MGFIYVSLRKAFREVITRTVSSGFFIFQMMDAIKGTMTEIYNDLSKNTTGSTIAEVRGDT